MESAVERCFRATVEYDGTDFAGFQWQPGLRTVQGELEAALHTLTERQERVVGAGRTDAGVHAIGQVISFRAMTRIPTARLATAMNSVLPPDVRIVAAEVAGEAFHARHSAKSRAYVYLILNRDEPSALWRRYAAHVRQPLNVEAMAAAAARLIGEKDFAAWANALSEVKTTVRRVMRFRVARRRGFVVLAVEASGFLHGMVRNMAGTLIQVGLGKRPADDVETITRSRDRSLAGPTAPACGLCLVRVTY